MSGGHPGLGTILGAVAVVLAVIALVLGSILPAAPAASTPGPSPITLTAVVSSTGSLARGSANNSVQVATGTYNVFFPQYLSGCSWSAAAGTTSYGGEPSAKARVSALPLATYGVTVTTYNATTGAAMNADFHLVGICPGGLWANVAGDATFQSGAGVTQTLSLGTGEYEVDFTQDVSGCAYIASLQGGSGSATTASRAGTPDGVYITTWSSSGPLVNASFSLSVYC
jgi:hypothetical protein